MASAVDQYSKAFARFFNASDAFAFWKGRVAMYAILKGMDVSEGDEIILPGYTCVMDVNPIKYLGAKPVYADIDPITYNVTPANLEAAITSNTKVIVAQHTYGYPCEMEPILEIGQKHNIPVIEDCCLAFGSTVNGKMCGTFGPASYFSFQWNKPFTTGIGGMALVQDSDLAQRIQTLYQDAQQPPSKANMMLKAQRTVYNTVIYPRTTAMITNLFRWMTRKGLVVGSSSTTEFVPEMSEDFFMAMGEGQAAAGLKKLKGVQANIAHRKKMRTIYDTLLRDAGFDIPSLPEWMDPVLVRYPVRVTDKQAALTGAPAAGVEIGSWFECPLHPIETPMHLYDYRDGMCPEAEKASREVINLPLHPRAGEKTAKRTVEFIRQFKP